MVERTRKNAASKYTTAYAGCRGRERQASMSPHTASVIAEALRIEVMVDLSLEHAVGGPLKHLLKR